MTYILRDYQQKAVNAALRFYEGKEREGVIVLPTGSGKSLVISSIAKGLTGGTVVFQPTKEILEQNLNKAFSFGIKNISVFSASLNSRNISELTFATIGTAKNNMDAFKDFKNIIIDECHLVNPKGGMYDDFLKYVEYRKVLGLTATPYRMHSYFDGSVVEAKFITRTRPRIFKHIIDFTDNKFLFDNGYLCPLKYITDDNYNMKDIRLNSTGKDFDEFSLKQYNARHSLVEKTFNFIMQNKNDRKHFLIFNKTLSENDELNSMLLSAGIKSAIVSSQTKKADRTKILNDFKSGLVKVVSNVGVLTVGFDFPKLDCIILARPTMSLALYYQMLGRGVRTAEGKEFCVVYDACNNSTKFGKVESYIIEDTGNAKYRLKSDNKYLTGYNFVTDKDVEAYRNVRKEQSTKQKQEIKSGEHVIGFGKFKDSKLKDLPDSYLEWCIKNFDNGIWKETFLNEINRRRVLL